jgi:acyl-CoA thioesterase-1
VVRTLLSRRLCEVLGVACFGLALLYPSFLAGIGDSLHDARALMQDDGIHPNAEAQPRILDNLWPQIESVLEASRSQE